MAVGSSSEGSKRYAPPVHGHRAFDAFLPPVYWALARLLPATGCLGDPLVYDHVGELQYIRDAGIVRNHLKPHLGRKKLKDLNRAEVRSLYNQKAKELSPRSVDYVHATLQKALKQAVRDDLVPRNVAEGERPRSSRRKKELKALSPTQVRALLCVARGIRNEALYVVAVHTGLRQGELLGLRWSDVDLEAGKLSVTRSLKVTADGLAFGAPKNQASRRSVPLNKSVIAALRTHKLRQNRERLSVPEWHDYDLVFPNQVGRPTDHNNLYYREFKPLLKTPG